MARTRGGGIRSSNTDRVAIDRQRPTASVRRHRMVRGAESELQHEEAEEHLVLVTASHPPQLEPQVDINLDGYPGGLHDTSLLTLYADHVAHKLWVEEDRGDLKCVSHGRKLSKFHGSHVQIQQIVADSGLAPLITSSIDAADKGLLSAFVERWHKETSSFHLPVGEMTITLDDVSFILHLPVTGALYSFEPMDAIQAIQLLVDLLGVTGEAAHEENRHCRGAHVRLSWLRDVYDSMCSQMRWTEAARAYLLHLVGCTIFADKSFTSVSVTLLDLFRDLKSCRGYAWGTAALTHMYYCLADASAYKTKQLAGCATLLQV